MHLLSDFGSIIIFRGRPRGLLIGDSYSGTTGLFLILRVFFNVPLDLFSKMLFLALVGYEAFDNLFLFEDLFMNCPVSNSSYCLIKLACLSSASFFSSFV